MSAVIPKRPVSEGTQAYLNALDPKEAEVLVTSFDANPDISEQDLVKEILAEHPEFQRITFASANRALNAAAARFVASAVRPSSDNRLTGRQRVLVDKMVAAATARHRPDFNRGAHAFRPIQGPLQDALNETA